METAVEPILLSSTLSGAKPVEEMRIETQHGFVDVVQSFRHIEGDCWQRALRDHAKDYRYYELVEETLSHQFEHRYFVLKNASTGEVAIQPFFFVNQDLTAGLPASFRRLFARVRTVWPRFLNLKMLMVGCSAGEGQLDSTAAWAVESLHEAIEKFSAGRTPIILLKDFPSQYRSALTPFSNNGYARVPSMPGATLELEFASFDDYMQRKLGKVFRKNLRRKFKDTQDLPITMEVVNDATPFVDEIFPLYHQTYEKSEFKFEELTKDYFREISRRMSDRARFFLWRKDGRLIAFALCLVHGETLYDLNVGMDYELALDLHLYFVTWRDIVQWAIANGL